MPATRRSASPSNAIESYRQRPPQPPAYMATGSVLDYIWAADQDGNGLPAINKYALGHADRSKGFVAVNIPRGRRVNRNHHLLECFLPSYKAHTYNLARALFEDAYFLDQRFNDPLTPQKKAEEAALLDAIIVTDAMKVAKSFVEFKLGYALSDAEWRSMLDRLWFQSFRIGQFPDLTGFEHCVIGEVKRRAFKSTVGGYHWWFKYLYNDNMVVGLPHRDEIDVLGVASTHEHPEVVTLKFEWNAHDVTGAVSAVKAFGGFFVGCSIEGLLALGTARAFATEDFEKSITLGSRSYYVAFFNDQSEDAPVTQTTGHIRDFFPM